MNFRKFAGNVRMAASLGYLPFRLLATPVNPSPNSISRFALHHYAIRTIQVPSEIRRFAAIVKERQPRTVVEIGTCLGGTLLVLSRMSHPLARIISIDLPKGPYGGGYTSAHIPVFKMFPRGKQSIHLIRGNSHSPQTREQLEAALWGKKIDLLFIDGDHSYEGVKSDYELYSPLVAKDGIIAFHDIAKHPPEQKCDVDQFWNSIKSDFRHEEIIENRDQGWAGIGVLYT